MEDTLSRRKLLKQTAVLGAAPLAGCVVDSGSEATDTPTNTTEQESPTHDHDQTEEGFSEEIRERAQEVGVETRKSVVEISFNDGRGGGTAWQIDDDHLITNAHIARQSETFEIETFDGTTGSAERVGYYEDMQPDIAMLRTDTSGIPPLSGGDSDTLTEGDPMVIVGHPSRVGSWVISLGPFRRYEEGIDWLLTDAPTNNGNSGSPLMTLEGEVVGCVSGTSTMGGEREPISRSDEVFEAFPEPDELATATPIETIRDSVTGWR